MISWTKEKAEKVKALLLGALVFELCAGRLRWKERGGQTEGGRQRSIGGSGSCGLIRLRGV